MFGARSRAAGLAGGISDQRDFSGDGRRAGFFRFRRLLRAARRRSAAGDGEKKQSYFFWANSARADPNRLTGGSRRGKDSSLKYLEKTLNWRKFTAQFLTGVVKDLISKVCTRNTFAIVSIIYFNYLQA
jgi:hypothetical protein